MIRINLLGQARPKAAKQAVPLEATVQIMFACVAIGVAVVVLGITYYQQKRQLDETNSESRRCTPKRPACSRSSRTWTSSRARRAFCSSAST